MTEKKLANEVAIVTGSDSGIGQATAVAFAREGADVAVTYLEDQKGAEHTVQLIEEAGQKAALVHLDQAQPKSVEQLFQTVKDKLGIPTVLVNNAAVSSVSTPVKDMSFEDWDHAIKTNLYGPFLCCQQFIRAIDGSDKRGVIINITSVHEEIANPGTADYCAAKGGLQNLTRVLALELGDKRINVNNIAPGMILTPMNQQSIDDPNAWKEKTQHIPMKRAGEPQEIAHAAVFLASKDGRYIHGTTLFVDGGLTQNMGQGA
ncbi:MULTISPECIES: SDR family oxidoreductase [unclassified Leptolyngbya]|uniref:SDR family NAD(P)-dependent oxidoreductase n=1 Tax=unclassified Leptolyngbya TaxID=2650499 RepID=UPI001689BCB2|nr:MULTISPECIES: SDR family oxidoreductase [unclassified Leptolyngbya]MBD1913988.1 SDR family oxidoreductase [Leptolyngbya sp. FACHB-8]MBD2154398.1 SDR family oxidoreductase [Leptolyngbya sp. FACHB-16]